jgi:acyl-CoA thioesterase FadM
MKVRFKKPLMIDEGKITIRAKLLEQNKRFALIHAILMNTSGVVCAEAELRYFLLSESDAREKYNYPGIDAFFET